MTGRRYRERKQSEAGRKAKYGGGRREGKNE